VSNLIFMDDRTAKTASQKALYRDRRYAIRYPFAADAVLIDLESGAQASGVTSDISLGGCFICTSKPLPLKARTRVRLSRKGDVVEALGVVRIVKNRVGMGVEFIDVDPSYMKMLSRWIEQLRQSR
jgi:c-di-GMP-binding flagellar brake protein YcgR